MTAPTGNSTGVHAGAGAGAGGRIVAVLALADEDPGVDELWPYLADPDAAVRRAALGVLTETAPDGAALALTSTLYDMDAEVRRAAADGLRELREVVTADAALAEALAAHTRSPHAETRVAVTRALWEHHLGDHATYRHALTDADPAVRREAVAGLVSLDAVADLVDGMADPDPLVRLAIARGLAALRDPHALDAIGTLALDEDLRVRAAALAAHAALGCPDRSLATVLAAGREDAWELREGAAIALRAAASDDAVPALLTLARDPHMDVRKAAVQSLAAWSASRQDVRGALEAALSDPDADVRGHARLALD